MLTEETGATTASNYLGLVKLLSLLRILPDALGETTLTTDEAAQIRSLGFAADTGRWKVPLVPPELVRDNPLLEHVSTGWKLPQTEATPNGANSKNQSCEAAQIIEGNSQSVLAATNAEGIRQPSNVSGQEANLQATAANRIRPAPARTIRQDPQLAVPSQQPANEGERPAPRRRRAGYQLPRSLQEQDRMAEEAASRID